MIRHVAYPGVNLLAAAIALTLCSCSTPADSPEIPDTPRGYLYIIGGGSRPPEMIRDMINLAGLDRSDNYGFILPMASSEPDSAIFYAQKQFQQEGVSSMKGLIVAPDRKLTDVLKDSILNASLVYITGGDQSRFMDAIKGSPMQPWLHQAYRNGSVIAGTSAGAAVMSALMITGDEKKHPEYQSTFRGIESDNIVLDSGLALTPHLLVDQHFLARSRYNRLLTGILEYPELTGAGIEESTALVLSGKKGRVAGRGQVVMFYFKGDSVRQQEGLLGGNNIQIDILLPGDSVYLP